MLPAAKAMPYCNTSQSHDARVDNILANLNIAEQISLLSPTEKPYCAVHTPSIDHIGMPKYKWLTEVNSVVSNTGCHSPTKCATQFIGPMGQGASFNRSSWWMKGDVISTDLRAYNNLHQGETGPLDHMHR
jgi:beta-glucosidase-like glycosyl hydrolase